MDNFALVSLPFDQLGIADLSSRRLYALPRAVAQTLALIHDLSADDAAANTQVRAALDDYLANYCPRGFLVSAYRCADCPSIHPIILADQSEDEILALTRALDAKTTAPYFHVSTRAEAEALFDNSATLFAQAEGHA